jgi:transmembrane sensor
MGRRQALLALGAVSVAAFSGWRGLRDTPLGDHFSGLLADYSTATGETQEVMLNNQSRLWLNTLSAVDLMPAPGSDNLHLLAGEILIDSQANAERGQSVRSAHGLISSRGATFSVRVLPNSTCVSVYNGHLQIASGNQRCNLSEGQQVSFSPGRFESVLAASASGRAWTQGILVAQGMSLQQFCQELSRYRHGYLGCAPGAEDLRVVGTFSIKDTDRALQLLASALPVTIKRVMPWWVTIEAKV